MYHETGFPLKATSATMILSRRSLRLSACPNCGGSTNPASEACPACGFNLGPPNVRMADTPEMRNALESRYIEAMERASARGAGTQAQQLETAGTRTAAVLSMGLSRAREFICERKVLYSNYHLLVRASVRQATDPENDRMRATVDATIHGSYAEKIMCAALSLDGVGPKSYGEISLRFRDVAVANRATILEQNSWTFVKSRNLFGKPLPPGHLALWGERKKLVCAKLADQLTSETKESDLARLILTQAVKRSDEEFFEVHIFGTFNIESIESVSGSSNVRSALDVAAVAVIKENLASLGKSWVEQ